MYFLSFRIFEQLALALKNEVALKFFTVLKFFLSCRIFEQPALALKTEFALKFFKPWGASAPSACGCSKSNIENFYSATGESRGQLELPINSLQK